MGNVTISKARLLHRDVSMAPGRISLSVLLCAAALALLPRPLNSQARSAPPVVLYATPLSELPATITDVATDAAGNAFVAGWTRTALPVAPDAFQARRAGATDGFVAKLNPTGILVWVTYLGGSGSDPMVGSRQTLPADSVTDIAVDVLGSVYVSGITHSTDFPVVNAQQASGTTFGGTGFVTKLDPTGRTALFSTYVGGRIGTSTTAAIAVTPLGEAFVAGQTTATDFIGAITYSPPGARSRLFIQQLGPSGGDRGTVTFGGTARDVIADMAIANDGSVHAVGETSSADFPLASAFQPVRAGPSGGSGFVLKLDAARRLAYSTFLGGGGSLNRPSSVAVDNEGRAVVAGETNSVDFPLLRPVQVPQGEADLFIARYDRNGRLELSTMMGGSREESNASIGTTVDGTIIVAGVTRSLDIPFVNPAPVDHPDAAVLRSDDGGARWYRPTRQAVWFTDMAIDPVSPEVVLGVEQGTKGRVWRSEDGGRSWTAMPEAPAGLHSLTFAAPPARAVYATSSNAGLYVSHDGGATWTLLLSHISLWHGHVRASPIDSARVYLGTTQRGMGLSTDGGRTWITLANGLPLVGQSAARIVELAPHPRDRDTLFAAVDAVNSGVARTFDEGRSWTPVLDARLMSSVAISSEGTTLYAGSRLDGLFVSRDRGQTWERPFPGRTVEHIVTDPVAASVAYAVLRHASDVATDLLRTNDYGRTWQVLPSPSAARAGLTVLAVSPRSPGRLYTSGPIDDATFFAGVRATGLATSIATSGYLEGRGASAMAVAPNGSTVIVTSRRLGADGVRLVRIAPGGSEATLR